MQDRFKFRVWNETKKYWEERAHISILYSQTELRIYKDSKNGWAQDAKQAGYKLDLEQCTGLKDKNGKLIYEGDIVKITDKSSRKEPFIGVVEYTNTASFEANCNGFYMHLHNPKTPENVSTVEKIFCSSLREIEVIGNIHQDKNILDFS